MARTHLLAAGVTRHEIAHRIAVGALHPLHRGVYAVGHTAVGALGRLSAALLACGTGAVLSHRTAAVLLGWLPPGGPIEVTVCGRHRDGRDGVVVHQATRVDVVLRHELRVTAPTRTLLDLAAAAADDELSRAVSEARVLRQLDEPALLAALAGRPGARRLRALLRHEPRLTRSEAERRFLALLDRAGLPRPRTNVRVGRFEVDAHWPQQRLVAEVDGYAFHGHRTAFERDRLRDAELQAAGHRVLRITWDQLAHHPEAVAARLATALATA